VAALVAANGGAAMPYGADPWTAAAEKAVQEVFERDCVVFLLPTGTAANALALAALTPPHGAIFCHEEAHIANDECGAPEFYSAGAKLVGLTGAQGRISLDSLKGALARFPRGLVKQVQPSALSLTQATECGTLYSLDELDALCAAIRQPLRPLAQGQALHAAGRAPARAHRRALSTVASAAPSRASSVAAAAAEAAALCAASAAATTAAAASPSLSSSSLSCASASAPPGFASSCIASSTASPRASFTSQVWAGSRPLPDPREHRSNTPRSRFSSACRMRASCKT
jgi:arginine/lysine/ornithine decarboxylase